MDLARRQPDVDEILLGDNLDFLPQLADQSFRLIYIDPPFNTGKLQTRKTLATVPDVDGDRTGIWEKAWRYRTKLLAEILLPRLV